VVCLWRFVIPAEGAILERIPDTAHSISPEGLSRHAYGQCHAARMRIAWGRRHQRRSAVAKGGDVLASAMQYDPSAVFEQQPVRVCGIVQFFPQPVLAAGGPARDLVDRLLEQAADDGAALAVLFLDVTDEQHVAGFGQHAWLNNVRARRSTNSSRFHSENQRIAPRPRE
jgi:hypothetical protein